eukprot:scaffold7209_cov551-Prasinococcus_capsulatus_cf.AAC.2
MPACGKGCSLPPRFRGIPRISASRGNRRLSALPAGTGEQPMATGSLVWRRERLRMRARTPPIAMLTSWTRPLAAGGSQRLEVSRVEDARSSPTAPAMRHAPAARIS